MKALLRFSLFSFLALALSFTFACQSNADDARAKARESLASTPEKNVEPNASLAQNNANAKSAPVEQVPAGPTTTLSFEQTTFDFGEVSEGEKVSHVYTFTNTGSEPLVISNAKGSCGCTVPQWPKTPIAPGDSGEIKVEFNTKGKPGKQTKRVTVTANTNPAQSFLTITGQVNKTEEPS